MLRLRPRASSNSTVAARAPEVPTMPTANSRAKVSGMVGTLQTLRLLYRTWRRRQSFLAAWLLIVDLAVFSDG